MNGLQLFSSLCCVGCSSRSRWVEGFWIRCLCSVNTSRNQSLLFPSCMKTPSCFQIPGEWWTFDSFSHTLTHSNPLMQESHGVCWNVELLTWIIFIFIINIILLKRWCFVIRMKLTWTNTLFSFFYVQPVDFEVVGMNAQFMESIYSVLTCIIYFTFDFMEYLQNKFFLLITNHNTVHSSHTKNVELTDWVMILGFWFGLA